jgi:hypothetical protein
MSQTQSAACANSGGRLWCRQAASVPDGEGGPCELPGIQGCLLRGGALGIHEKNRTQWLAPSSTACTSPAAADSVAGSRPMEVAPRDCGGLISMERSGRRRMAMASGERQQASVQER